MVQGHLGGPGCDGEGEVVLRACRLPGRGNSVSKDLEASVCVGKVTLFGWKVQTHDEEEQGR